MLSKSSKHICLNLEVEAHTHILTKNSFYLSFGERQTTRQPFKTTSTANLFYVNVIETLISSSLKDSSMFEHFF